MVEMVAVYLTAAATVVVGPMAMGIIMTVDMVIVEIMEGMTAETEEVTVEAMVVVMAAAAVAETGFSRLVNQSILCKDLCKDQLS